MSEKEFEYRWTTGEDPDFDRFHSITEAYYNKLAGGAENRKAFTPNNTGKNVRDALVVYDGKTPIACSALRHYNEQDIEIKRVWVEPEYRRNGLGMEMLKRLEKRAREKGYKRLILQTRKEMASAMWLYTKLGFTRIENYPPYDKLPDAACLGKEL